MNNSTLYYFSVKLWRRSGDPESAYLAPMWPWSKPGPSVVSVLCFRIVGSRPCSEEIFSRFSSFPLSTKIDIAKFQIVPVVITQSINNFI